MTQDQNRCFQREQGCLSASFSSDLSSVLCAKRCHSEMYCLWRYSQLELLAVGPPVSSVPCSQWRSEQGRLLNQWPMRVWPGLLDLLQRGIHEQAATALFEEGFGQRQDRTKFFVAIRLVEELGNQSDQRQLQLSS